jgi:hypothetical protein
MDPVSVDTFVQLLRSHAWIAILSILVGILVRLSKTDVAWFKWNTKPEHRAFWAMGLAMLGAALDRLASGGTWYDAIAGGVVAGSGAIATHEVVVNGMRRGRDFGVPRSMLPPPPPPWHDDSERPPRPLSPWPKMVALGALVLVGCSSAAVACPILDLAAKVCPMIVVKFPDGSTELVPRDRIADVALQVRAKRLAAADGGTE